MIGTPAYMSPEQASGGDADARSDLFSLGCVLYHAATGRRPFLGCDALTTLVAVTTVEPPAPRELNPALPDELNTLIVSLLSKDPAGRPQTAREVAERLAGIILPLHTGEGGGESGLQQSERDVLSNHRSPHAPREGTHHAQRDDYGSPSDAALLPLPPGEGWGEGASNKASASVRESAPTPVGNAHPTKPPRRRGLALIGVAAAAAALLAGVVIIIKDREGRVVAEIEADSPVKVKTADGATTEIRAAGPADTADTPADTASAGNGVSAVPAARSDNPRQPAAETTKPESKIGNPKSPQPLPAMSAMSLVTEPAPIAGVKSWTLETLDHRGDIYHMEFNPDGTLLATCGEDGAVRLWNSDTGELARIFVGADSPSGGIAWSPDGASIAVAAGAKIKAWQAATGKSVCTVALIDGEAASLAWSPDGKTFALGQRPLDQPEAPARQLCLYDTASGERTAARHRDDWSVEQIAWSPDGKRLLATGENSPVWLVERGELSPRAMPAPFPWNASLGWNDDGIALAAGIRQVDGKLVGQLWQADPPKLLRTFATKLEGEQVGWLALSGDGRFVVAGCRDTFNGYPSERAAYVYEAATGNAVAHFDRSAAHPSPWVFPEEAPISFWEYEPHYALSRDGRRLARCGRQLGGPALFDTATGDSLQSPKRVTTHWGQFIDQFCGRWSRSGGSLAWRAEDGAIHFWPRETASTQIATPAPPSGYPGFHPFSTTDLAWSHDDRSLLAAFDTGTRIDRYSPSTGELESRRETATDSPRGTWAPAFSHDLRRLAGRLNDGFRVGIFDLDSSEPRKVLDAITDDIVVWSPDGRHVSTRHGEATEIWDIEANECVRRFDGGKASLVWSPDGSRFVLSGSGEATIHDAASGNVLHSLDDPPLGATKVWPRLAWSPDSRRIAGRGRIWDAETGEVIARLPGTALAGEIGAPAWSPDGTTLAYLGPGRAVVVAEIGHREQGTGNRKDDASALPPPSGEGRGEGGLTQIPGNELIDDRSRHAPRDGTHHAERDVYGGQTADATPNPKSKIQNRKSKIQNP